MATLNAEKHPVQNRFKKPSYEKLFAFIVPENVCEPWLTAPSEVARAGLMHLPVECLRAGLLQS